MVRGDVMELAERRPKKEAKMADMRLEDFNVTNPLIECRH